MYNEILQEVGSKSARLVAVSKTKSSEEILEVYQKGQRDFGENRVQELISKKDELPADIRWHLIGHLQKNKVKYVVPFVYLIHSVDSAALLFEIQKRAKNIDRIVKVLIQMKIAQEESKFGLAESDISSIFDNNVLEGLSHVEIHGLMGMASFTDDRHQIRKEFDRLANMFNTIKRQYPVPDYFKELSMGMSSDYHIALDAGSTMVRIGSLIFGKRACSRV